MHEQNIGKIFDWISVINADPKAEVFGIMLEAHIKE